MKVANQVTQHPQEPERGKGKLNFSAKANKHRFKCRQQSVEAPLQNENQKVSFSDLDLEVENTRGLCLAKGPRPSMRVQILWFLKLFKALIQPSAA